MAQRVRRVEELFLRTTDAYEAKEEEELESALETT
jgi:hypothetical protein